MASSSTRLGGADGGPDLSIRGAAAGSGLSFVTLSEAKRDLGRHLLSGRASCTALTAAAGSPPA